jgi:hypothetical protein
MADFTSASIMPAELIDRYKKAAKNAIECGNACNLSGIVFSFATDMQTVCDVSNALGKGTEWKNGHPIAVMYSSKIAEMTLDKLTYGYAHVFEAESNCHAIIASDSGTCDYNVAF